jgi:signal transduction histidine kinase
MAVSNFQNQQILPFTPISFQQIPTPANAINPQSRLQDLPLHHFALDRTVTGQVLADWFQDFPQIPGVILLDTQQPEPSPPIAGMISRSRFLEILLNPVSRDIFLTQPLKALQTHLRSTILKLPGHTPILIAAQQALRRSPESLSEPILVELDAHNYRLLDFHTLNIAYWQIRGIETQVWYERTQVQMIRSDKMASLGRLVDGVAHEILDPVSFIWGNLSHLMTYEQDVMRLLDRYESELKNPSPELLALCEDIEIDYLREDIPKTLDSIKSGADRLTKLATSLQNFCHIDEVYPKSADIHDCLDGVLLLLKSRLKSDIPVLKRYGHLPAVPCFIGKITQVFLNLLSYLIDQLLTQAITDRIIEELPLPAYELNHSPNKPILTVTTETCSIDGSGARWISIRIGRNGDPLAIAQQQQVLDSFLQDVLLTPETSLVTTYRIITIRHRGFLKLRTAANPADHLEPGISTEFEILIPLT